jgi:hypothetical protein
MAPSTSTHKYSKRSSLARPKPNLLRHSTMERKRAPCVRALKNSATPNHRPQSRQTTALLQALPKIVSNKSDPKPSTCVSIGFEIAFAKANLLSAGKRAFSTRLIILPNIILLRIIATFALPTCILRMIAPATISNASKMPMLQKRNLCPAKLSHSRTQYLQIGLQ